MPLKKDRLECFGNWDRVFPLGEDGLRNVTDDCRECPQVQACLKAGSESPEGLEMRASRFEDMGHKQGRGVTAFLSRWSELKTIRRQAGRKEDK